MTDILSRIDDTLTYHSAGLGEDVTVPVERGISLDDLVGEPIAGRQSTSFEVSGFYEDGAFDFIYSAPRVRNIEIRGIPGTIGTFRADGEVEPELGESGIVHFGIKLSDTDNRRLQRWLSPVRRRARLRRMHHLYYRRRVR